jgi:REP element-mobilizing transposase RayT
VIYFLTICITPRCKALANDAAWRALCETLERLDKWNTYCIMVMPDHIHLLTAPLDRELSVAAFLKWLKRWFNKSYDARRQWAMAAGRLRPSSSNVGVNPREVELHSRESGESWSGRALEAVAISKRLFRQ